VPTPAAALTIVPFRPELAAEFDRINRAWITTLFALEPADVQVLADPGSEIVTPGGQVFFALLDRDVVGTAAAIRRAPDRFELAKMAVVPGHQGRGIGERLGRVVIAFAAAAGAASVELFTNSRLDGAIRLYQRLGFTRRPLPPVHDHQRADVYMVLQLPPSSG
jgi:GNAT superfamily N-acetyltransferase